MDPEQSSGFDGSEVGLVEQSANSDAPDVADEAPAGDLMAELGQELDQPEEPEAEATEEPVVGAEGDEEAEGEESAEEQKPTGEEEETPKSRSQKRIQDLVRKNHETEQRYQQQQAQMQQYLVAAQQQQAQQYQAAQAQMAEVLKATQAQLEVFKQRAQREEEAALPYAEQVKRDIARQAQEQAKQQLMPELEALKQELRQQQEASARLAQQQQQKARYVRFSREASMGAQQVLGSLGLQEDGDAAGAMEDMLLAYIAAKGVDVKTAAAEVTRLFDKAFAGKLKSKAKPVTAKAKSAAALPAAPKSRKAGASGGRPSWGAVKAAGFSNFVEWANAGRPTLTEPK